MKKLALTIAIVLGLGLSTFAEQGGLFNRGAVSDEEYYGMGSRSNNKPLLPFHEYSTNQNANTPLGSGAAILLGLGAAYLVGKKRREE